MAPPNLGEPCKFDSNNTTAWWNSFKHIFNFSNENLSEHLIPKYGPGLW